MWKGFSTCRKLVGRKRGSGPTREDLIKLLEVLRTNNDPVDALVDGPFGTKPREAKVESGGATKSRDKTVKSLCDLRWVDV